MAIESNKTIFMGLRKPSDKCLLVSIPMNMYRIQTNKFTSGLNYFQKAVLKLKFMPKITNAKIASLLHLDEHLVNIIVSQLEAKELINVSGSLTEKGKELRNDSDNIIIDEREKQIGYVFTYSGGQELFPYYQTKINYAEIINNELYYNTDNGPRTVESPIDVCKPMDCTVSPSEDKILQIIKNSVYHSIESEEQIDDITNGNLKIRFLPDDRSVSVCVCTYIYLAQSSDGNTYSDDWLVLDPFGNGDNYELKLYLEQQKKKNKDFAMILHNTFKDALTENNRRFNESKVWFETTVQERINNLFEITRFEKLPSSIQDPMHEVVSNYMHMECDGFKEIAMRNKQLFFLNMQNALENVLLKDQKDREGSFFNLDLNYGEYSSREDRKDCLKKVFSKKLLSDTTLVPGVIFKNKTNTWKGKSLLDYLMKFIMSISVEQNLEDCKLISVFKNRIDTIIAISEQRNKVCHGNKDSNNDHSSFNGEDAKEYFSFMTNFINDYLNTI